MLTIFRVLSIALVLYFLTNANSFAQDEPSQATQSLAEKRYALFTEQAAQIELATKRSEKKLALREQPLQKFSSDGNTFGSVYLWKAEDGRPATIGTIGSLPINGTDFGFTELHWLLDEPLAPAVIGKALPKQWSATGEDLKPKPIDTNVEPAASAVARLTQMRTLARNFNAHMTQNTTRNELRLLPQPLYRYDDPTNEKDGAIFAYVWTIGTDPELLIHIHTRKQDDQIKWFYQPIRFTWRKLELAYDGAEVWKSEEFLNRNDLLQTGPYITTLTEAIRQE